MSKHTPGPWVVGFGGTEGDGYATITSGFRGRAIAEMTTSDEIQEHEMNNNASLIAAAPELLEACKWALKECGAEAKEIGLFDVLGAAIAKAEGE